MKKTFNKLTIILLALIMTVSCTSKKSATTVSRSDITGKYWKLVELNGKTVSAEITKTPYIMLNNGKIAGTGGCNQFSGTYTVEQEVHRVRFVEVIMTQKACFAENADSEFAKVLEMTDNYSVSTDGLRLTFNRLRMAPLAVFELVEIKTLVL